MKFDVVVIGGGPVGLCFATALAKAQLKVCVVEKQSEQSIAEPAFDGREIALTHRSVGIMKSLGLWSRIVPEEIAPLKAAQVLNGASHYQLLFDHRQTDCEALGYLIPNHLIRRAAYACAANEPGVTLLTDRQVRAVEVGQEAVTLRMDGGDALQCPLLIAADSRFSETRRSLGIAADMLDFGKTMLVCRMQHERSHEQTAWEWFGERQTLALLPLNGNQSSVVITVPAVESTKLQHMDEAAFNREMEIRFEGRLGRMQLTSTRHAYPLVATYSRRFVGARCALLGDAAVGMHPVTAHGFNLGLQGQECLRQEAERAALSGHDIGDSSVLERYETAHRRNARPLYLATNAIVRLYTDAGPLAKLGRSVGLRLANRFPPFKQSLLSALTEAG